MSNNDLILNFKGKDFNFKHRYSFTNGIKTHFVEIGSSDKVLLILGGFPGPWSTYWEMEAILSSNFKIIGLELPGFLGETEGFNGDYTLDKYTNFVETFLINNNINPKYILGISYGGKITLDLLNKFPNISEKVILYAPAYCKIPTINSKVVAFSNTFRPILYNKILNSIINPILVKSFLLFGVNHLIKMYKLENMNVKTKNLLIKEVKRAKVLPLLETSIDLTKPMSIIELRKISKRILVISGSADESVPADKSLFLAKNVLLNASYIEFPELGHWMGVTQPEQVAAVIMEFFI